MKMLQLLMVVAFAGMLCATAPVSFSDQATDVRTVSGSLANNSNLKVEIWSASTGGSLIYTETFTSAVMNGRWNVMLGTGGASLDLDYGTTYYRMYYVGGMPVDLYDTYGVSIPRIPFQSPLGEITNLTTATSNIAGMNLTVQQLVSDNATTNGRIDSVNGTVQALVVSNNTTNARIDNLNFTLVGAISGSGTSGVVPVFNGSQSIKNSSITYCSQVDSDTVGINSACSTAYQDATVIAATNWKVMPGTISTVVYVPVDNVTVLSISGGAFPTLGIAGQIFVTDTLDHYYIVSVPSSTDLRIEGNQSFTNSTWQFKQAPYYSVSGENYEERGYEIATNGNWNWAMYAKHGVNNQQLCFQNSVFPTTDLMCLNENGDLDIFGSLNPSAFLALVPKYAGFTTEPTFTVNDTAGTITFASNGIVNLYNNSAGTGVAQTYNLSGGTTGVELPALPVEQTSYVIGEYNGGSPRIWVTTNPGALDGTTATRLLTVFRNTNNELYILDWDSMANAMPERLNQRLIKTDKYARESGLVVGELPGRYLTSTGGIIWYGNVNLVINDTDSNVSGLDMWYHNATGDYVVDDSVDYYQTENWDNGTALVPLAAGQYANIWVYQKVSEPSEIDYIVGHASYNSSADALTGQPPGSVPAGIESNYVLIGRIVFEVNATSASYVDSTWGQEFTGSVVNDHNALGGLQGGAGGSYYHLGSTDYGIVQGLPTSLSTGYIDFTNATPSNVAGRLYYDPAVKTVVIDQGTTSVALGREQFFIAKNDNAFAITAGKVVYLTGADSGYPTIGLADASSPSTSFVVGIVQDTINAGATGIVFTSGIITGMNTNGMAAGSNLFLSTVTGEYTTTGPTPPDSIAQVGKVLIEDPLVGKILFSPRINPTQPQTNYNLWVQTNVTAQDFLQAGTYGGYNSTTINFIGPINATTEGTAANGFNWFTHYSNDIYAGSIVGQKARGTEASPTATKSGDRLMSIGGRGYGATGFPTGTANSSSVILFNADENYTDSAMGSSISFVTTPNGAAPVGRAERMRVSNSGNVGINTTSPNYTLDVIGTVRATTLLGNLNASYIQNPPWLSGVPYQSSAAGWTNNSTTTSTSHNVSTSANFIGNINASYVQNAPWAGTGTATCGAGTVAQNVTTSTGGVTSQCVTLFVNAYGGMTNSTAGGTTTTATGVWANILGFGAGTMNGWYMGTGSNLTCNTSGTYEVHYALSFSQTTGGGNGDVIKSQLLVNGVAVNRSLSTTQIAANGVFGNLGASLLWAFNVGDNVTMQIQDATSNGKVTTWQNRNVIVTRVGN